MRQCRLGAVDPAAVTAAFSRLAARLLVALLALAAWPYAILSSFP